MGKNRVEDVFAERLVQLREIDKVSQQTLAEALGITRQSLSLYETAQRTIKIDLLLKISEFFHVSTDYLLGKTNYQGKDFEISDIAEKTHLPGETVEKICEFSLLESTALNALTDGDILFGVGLALLNYLKYEVARKVLFKEFLLIHKIKLPSEIDVEIWGESSLDLAFGRTSKKRDELHSKFNDFLRNCDGFIPTEKESFQSCGYSVYSEIFNGLSDIHLAFRNPCIWGNGGKIYHYYKTYYEEYYRCKSKEERDSMEAQEYTFFQNIVLRGQKNNG